MVKLQTTRENSTITEVNQKPHWGGLKALNMSGIIGNQATIHSIMSCICASGTHTEVSGLRHFAWLLGNKGPAIPKPININTEH